MLVRHIGLLSRSANAIGNNDILANEIGSDDILSNTADVNDARDNNDNVDDLHWHFCEILSHEEVNRHSQLYQGSNFNVRVLWDNGEITDEPLQLFGRDAPVEYAAYAQENNLLDTQEWKRFRRLTRRYHLLNERSALRLPAVLWSALKSTLPFLEALFLSLTFIDFSLLSSYMLYAAGSFASYAAVPMNAICLHPLRGILMMGSEKFDKTEVSDVSRDSLFWMYD